MSLYAGIQKVCPTIGFFIIWLNLDGGIANSIYVYDQVINGGTASISGNIREKIDGGNA